MHFNGLQVEIGPLHNLIKMKKVIMVFSAVLKNKAPANLHNLFELVKDAHNVPTKSSIPDLKVPKVRFKRSCRWKLSSGNLYKFIRPN
jgi:hypothetical protein